MINTTEVIPGTDFCDNGDNRQENNARNSATHVISANVCNVKTVINEDKFIFMRCNYRNVRTIYAANHS